MKHKAAAPNLNYINTKSVKSGAGFTLMEIMVASVLFVIISGSLLSLFNYILKINRRTEALRQASQGTRNFMEFLVKEIRNGQIDYYVANGQINMDPIDPASPCEAPGQPGTPATDDDTYVLEENKLGIINTDNIQECFYFGKDNGDYVDIVGAPALTFSAPNGSHYTLALWKAGIAERQILNPPNLRVDNLSFFIRPLKDPYIAVGGFTEVQPAVAIAAKFTVKLPTGEEVPLYYQTSVSNTKYDIPSE